MKLLIGIPAFNEGSAVGQVIKYLPKKIKKIDRIDILVVDDGSIDNTASVAITSGAAVLSHLLNRGLGGALKTIFEYAENLQYDILVTFDADGQHRGEDIEKLIQPILNKKKDVVIGARWLRSGNAPFSRKFANHLANLLTLFLCGIYTRDSQSGLRAFNKKAIKSVKIQTDGMEVSSEIFREIKKNNLNLAEVPIKAIYTQYSLLKGQRLSDSPDVLFRLMLRLIR